MEVALPNIGPYHASKACPPDTFRRLLILSWRRASVAKRILTKQLDLIPTKASLEELREAAKSCKNCDLWKLGTQTVFGEGSAQNKLMFVGELRGDQEVQAGNRLLGPAGRLLDNALVEARIDGKKV